MSEADIAWIAGLFEGEACFDCHTNPSGKKYPRIRIEMNDRDVIERVKSLIPKSGEVCSREGKKAQHSKTYTLRICSRESVEETLNLIYPYMGERRKKRIEELLDILSSQNPAYR